MANFAQDYEVIEALVNEYFPHGCASTIFADHLPIIDNKFYKDGWVTMDSIEIKSRKVDDLHEPTDKEAGRLLLLLAYMMASNVKDDNSIKTQM